MDVRWFEIEGRLELPAGAHVLESEDPRGEHEHGECVTLFVGSGCAPDWIRLPPELGARAERVSEIFEAPCVGQGCAHETQHARLESLCVCVCPVSGGYLWYRRKDP